MINRRGNTRIEWYDVDLLFWGSILPPSQETHKPWQWDVWGHGPRGQKQQPYLDIGASGLYVRKLWATQIYLQENYTSGVTSGLHGGFRTQVSGLYPASSYNLATKAYVDYMITTVSGSGGGSSGITVLNTTINVDTYFSIGYSDPILFYHNISGIPNLTKVHIATEFYENSGPTPIWGSVWHYGSETYQDLGNFGTGLGPTADVLILPGDYALEFTFTTSGVGGISANGFNATNIGDFTSTRMLFDIPLFSATDGNDIDIYLDIDILQENYLNSAYALSGIFFTQAEGDVRYALSGTGGGPSSSGSWEISGTSAALNAGLPARFLASGLYETSGTSYTKAESNTRYALSGTGNVVGVGSSGFVPVWISSSGQIAGHILDTLASFQIVPDALTGAGVTTQVYAGEGSTTGGNLILGAGAGYDAAGNVIISPGGTFGADTNGGSIGFEGGGRTGIGTVGGYYFWSQYDQAQVNFNFSGISITTSFLFPSAGGTLVTTATGDIRYTLSGTSIGFTDLTDVTIAIPISGQLVGFNGSEWVNTSASGVVLAGGGLTQAQVQNITLLGI